MKLTAKKAKKLTIEIWTYLAEHPEIKLKQHLPIRLYNQIDNMSSRCPLCEFNYDTCEECILNNCEEGSDFDNWDMTSKDDIDVRKEAATNIVNKVKSWKIK